MRLDADGEAATHERITKGNGLGGDALLQVDGAGAALGSLDEGNEEGGAVGEFSVRGADGNLDNGVVEGAGGRAREVVAAEHHGLEDRRGEGDVRTGRGEQGQHGAELRDRGAARIAGQLPQDRFLLLLLLIRERVIQVVRHLAHVARIVKQHLPRRAYIAPAALCTARRKTGGPSAECAFPPPRPG